MNIKQILREIFGDVTLVFMAGGAATMGMAIIAYPLLKTMLTEQEIMEARWTTGFLLILFSLTITMIIYNRQQMEIKQSSIKDYVITNPNEKVKK